MRSTVEIVADTTDDGRTVLACLRATGQLAARCTAPGTVHLVGTAAGPLGGDVLEVTVLVRAGARLSIRAVAATLAMPGRSGRPARSLLDLTVQDGGRLDHALAPLVVCRGADLTTTTRLTVNGCASAELVEQVVLGRHGEDGGDWTGRSIVDHDGHPVLRTTHRSSVLRATRLSPGTDGTPPVRALVSRLRIDPGGRFETATSGAAVACPLAAGGLLVTAIAPDLATAIRQAELVCPATAGPDDARPGRHRDHPGGQADGLLRRSR